MADVFLEIEGEERYFRDAMRDFETVESDGAARIHITIETGELPKVLENCLLQTEELVIYAPSHEYIIQYCCSETVCCCRLATYEERAIIYTKEAAEDGKDIIYAIRNIFFYYIQRRGMVVIHSASFLYRGMVWLFSAPSGTGKSSHVAFWKECGYPVEDFNGDMAVCYQDKTGRVLAAGTPWCGTSGICRNLIAPLGGILFLKQGERNAVRRLDGFQGILQMIARCLTPNWDQECVERNITIAERLAKKILMGEMICTYEKEAAGVSKAFIDEILDKQ